MLMPKETNSEPPIEETYPQDDKSLEKIIRASLQGAKKDGKFDEELVNDITRYLLLQYNSESLRGSIEYDQFCAILDEGNKGLYSLTYLKHYTNVLENRDSIYFASLVLMSELITRVYKGKDFSLLELKEKAKGAQAWAAATRGGN